MGDRDRPRSGVDGADSINFTAKAPGLPDAPILDPHRNFQPFGPLSINRPRVHDYLKEMHEKVLRNWDMFA